MQAGLVSVPVTARHCNVWAYGPRPLNFNSHMSTASVFFYIEEAFDTTWHLGLLHKLSELTFSISQIKFINCFLSQRKVRVSVEDEMSTLRDIQAGVHKVPFCPEHCTVYI
jgi:hypothetical protein